MSMPRWLRPVLVATGALAAFGLASTVRRVAVEGGSMAPALLPGDRLLIARWPVSRGRLPAVGDIVAVRDPRLATRVLIKRVTAIDTVLDTLEVTGDAGAASTDSRQFGAVHRSAVLGKAIYRYAPPTRSGPGPWPEEYHQA
jgi:nickel-type superoxide dismutase maturation protease